MTGPKGEAGFTLAETLVAVFALAMLMSAGGLLLQSTLNAGQVVKERLARLERFEIMSAHLRADLGGAVARTGRSGNSVQAPQSFYGGAPDRENIVLGLIRSGWTNINNEADRSDLLSVDYRYENGQLIRRIYQSPDRTRQTPEHETVLIEGVARFDIAFFAGGLPANIWGLARQGKVAILPDAVTLEIAFESGEQLTQSFLVGSPQ